MRPPPSRVATVLTLLTLGCSLIAVPGASAQNRIIQTLSGFYSPAAALFSPDGDLLFVANTARGRYGMLARRGSIARVNVAADGKLTIDNPRYIENLNAPVGLAWLGRGSTVFPAGSLLIAVGGSWTVDANGRPLSDERERGAGVVVCDPASGEELGRIYLGAGSPVKSVLGHSLLDPTAIAADPEGNVYVADMAGSNAFTVTPGSNQPGIVKLTPAAIDALAREQEPPAGSVRFAPVPDLPTGLMYSRREGGSLLWVTGQAHGDLGGGVLRLPKGDFDGTVETVGWEMSSLACLTETPNGTIVAGRMNGDMVYVRGRSRGGRVIRFRGDPSFLSPGQLASKTLPNGEILIVVPELGGGGIGAWRQHVQVITLPANF